MRRKVCYQNGNIQFDQRTNKWYYRWRERVKGKSVRRSEVIGTLRQYPTEAKAWRAAEPLRAKVNQDVEVLNPARITVREVVQKYMGDEMPSRFSTQKGYRCNLENHILPAWGDREIASLNPNEVEVWLKRLKYSPKTKTHLRNLLRLLVNSAMRRGYIEIGRNPIELVRVPNATMRKARTILTMPEFAQVLAGIVEEPFRTMVLLAMCLGLRSCELAGLQWGDVDWQNLMLRVRRNVVEGRVDGVKTRKSEAEVPLDPAVAEIMLAWKRKTHFPNEQDWVFASPFTGGRLPYLAKGIQQRHIRVAAEDAGLEHVGWHTFRHTYRRMLSKTGAAMDVQRDLMRHASITTTIDVYGSIGEQEEYFEPMRAANSAVVGQVPK